MLMRTPLQRRPPPSSAEPGTIAIERPSPTKRPRAPPDHVDDDDFLSRRALEVYNGAQRSGGRHIVTLKSPRSDNVLGSMEFEDDLEQYVHGNDHFDTEDHDHLDDSIRCTYKCRNMVKSEVLETLDMREKQVVELNTALKSLKTELATSEAGEKRLMENRKSLEQVVAASGGREASMHAHRLQESAKADEMLRTQLKRCHELQGRLQEEMQLKAEAEKIAMAAEARALEAEQEKLKKQENSAREIVQLKWELSRVRRDSDYNLKRIKAESSIQLKQAHLAAEEADSLLSQLDEEQKLLAKTVEEKQELEHKLADVMKQLATQTTRPEEADTVIRHLQEELKQSSADVAEARKLKQIHRSAALLKEQLQSEKSRADRAEASLADLVNVHSRVQELEAELEQWSDMVEAIPGAHSRDDVPRRFAELQREAVAATVKIGDVTAQVAELQVAYERAENHKKQAEARTVALREEVADAMMKLKRQERKVAMLSTERDGLKRILESYDNEEAVIASHRKHGDSVSSMATPEKSKEGHIKELSSFLADAEQHATQLEEALLESNNTTTEQRQKIESLAEELNDAFEKIKSLEREGDRLRKDVAALELHLGRGEFNQATTKVLHLINNLESDQSSKPVEVTKGNAKIPSQEVAALTKQIASLEKREARYRQIFADKISLFREACYLLFGFKVQMHEEKDSATQMPVTVFTLQSIYAQSDDDKLLFQLNSGQMDMLANEYTTSPELERQVRTFLKNFKSIPAFMANLTMELFNTKTLG